MVELTSGLVGGSFVVLLVTYAIAFAFQIYMMYLNIKQSRVNDQMTELVNEVKLLRKDLRNARNK